jgi:hypothetical protein
MRNNNINHIDTRSREMLERGNRLYTEPDRIPFYSSFANITPTKIEGRRGGNLNTSYMFPSIINRASMVSQTTHYSSNNKKNYDLSTEHLESEEK